MGRTASTTGTTDTTTASAAKPREPEIMRSAMLANIITLELVDMIDEAATRHEREGQGRRMAATLAAVRGLVRDLRAVHALPVINWRTGLPEGEPVPSENGAEPEPAEVTS
jgi:hypothetical protein